MASLFGRKQPTHRTGSMGFTLLIFSALPAVTRPIVLALALAVLPALWSPSARAQTPNIIVDIQITGMVQVSEGEIFSNLASRVGGAVDRRQITRDIKVIFSLGFFDDVKAEVEEEPGQGFILRFVVREKPRIVAIRVIGNTQVGDTKIQEVLTLQVGTHFNRNQLRDNVEKIRDLYRSEGFFKVQVSPDIQTRGPYRYDITIQIQESPKLYITDIRARGTVVFSEMEIRRMLLSAEVDCFDWMSDSGVFDEAKINEDLRIIVTRYLELGYIRVFIDKPKITLIHNREFSKIIVEFDITEGQQYFTGKIDITGDVLGDKQKLIDRMGLKSGEVHNAIRRTRDRFMLRSVYQEQGYAFVQVRPGVKINDQTRIVDLDYVIAKNDKAYIGRIEFQGNSETRDFVMRREFEVRENELYNGRKLQRSQRNLSALGYFEPSLSIVRKQRTDENILDLSTRVTESQTGTLQAQMAFSEQSGLSIGVSVSKGNFLGNGQTLRVTAQVSQRNVTQNISVDFIEPHIFGSEFSSDSTVAFRQVEDQSELDRGEIEEIRGSQGFGYPILPNLRLGLSFSGTNRTFKDVDDDPVKLRTFTTSLTYNTVNHPVFPTDGTSITFAISQTGGQLLGGTTEYRRYRLLMRDFSSLNDDNTLILMFRVRLSFLEQVGDNQIPLEERFRLGGINSLRGYRFNEIGGPFGRLEQNLNAINRLALDSQGQPVLDTGGQPITETVDRRTLGLDETSLEKLAGGGTVERLFNLELLFPLAGTNVRGVIFYDAGQVNSEKEQYEILKEEEPKYFELLHSIGGGIRIITPLGVLRFEYGRKLKIKEGESPDEFEFTISTLF